MIFLGTLHHQSLALLTVVYRLQHHLLTHIDAGCRPTPFRSYPSNSLFFNTYLMHLKALEALKKLLPTFRYAARDNQAYENCHLERQLPHCPRPSGT